MKILFLGWDPTIVPESRTVDYMGDCVYHGLKSVLGRKVYTAHDQAHMYTDFPKEKFESFHGKGFTLCGNLPVELRSNHSEEKMLKNIQSKFYDCVIFSRIHRSALYYTAVTKYYDDNEIIVIDGHDSTDVIQQFLKHTYYKRELVTPHENLHPISFSIPKEKVFPASIPVRKTRSVGTVIPGQQHTYIFNNEDDYYTDYRHSFYGVTHKKGGWDCMRHLEIMANKCLPYFSDIEDCPAATMMDYPKDLLAQTKILLENQAFTEPLYKEYLEAVYLHVIEHQTTEAVANRIIKTISEQL